MKKLILLGLVLLFIPLISAENNSRQFVFNESCASGDCWIPWLADSLGRPFYNINMLNLTTSWLFGNPFLGFGREQGNVFH